MYRCLIGQHMSLANRQAEKLELEDNENKEQDVFGSSEGAYGAQVWSTSMSVDNGGWATLVNFVDHFGFVISEG